MNPIVSAGVGGLMPTYGRFPRPIRDHGAGAVARRKAGMTSISAAASGQRLGLM